MEHFKNFLRGAGDLFRMTPEPRGYRVDARGFQTDAAKLTGDIFVVGRDMRSVLKRDKQTYERTRKG